MPDSLGVVLNDSINSGMSGVLGGYVAAGAQGGRFVGDKADGLIIQGNLVLLWTLLDCRVYRLP